MPSLYIDGPWVASGDGACSPVINPSDGTIVTEVDVATDEQVQAAIAAARRAFDDDRLAVQPDRRSRRAPRCASPTCSTATRSSSPSSRRRTPARPCARAAGTSPTWRRVFRYYAQLADKDGGRLVDTSVPTAISRIVYEPVGVCGLIAPWNYPLLQLSWKIAPALAAGNTAVMKPATVTPLTAIAPDAAARGGRHAAGRRQPRPRARASASGRPSPTAPTSTSSR